MTPQRRRTVTVRPHIPTRRPTVRIGLVRIPVLFGGCLGIIVTLLAFWTASALFWGWVLMLILGSLHDHHVITQSWGYGICFPLGYACSLFLG
jgi:hypothetical protein